MRRGPGRARPATAMDPELAAVTAALPDYEVGRELGRGAFGVVWAGRHRHLGRPVAIKQLKGPGTDAAEHASRFRREARILAQLDHPHVVGVYDYREEGDLRLLVMAHLGGGTLTDRLQAGMGPEAGLVTVIAAATALHHVHQQGVLHRDVKPDNLMFDERGVLKVTDFGVARGDVKVATAVHLTHLGQFFGTPAYVAPEQAEAAFGTTLPAIGPAAGPVRPGRRLLRDAHRRAHPQQRGRTGGAVPPADDRGPPAGAGPGPHRPVPDRGGGDAGPGPRPGRPLRRRRGLRGGPGPCRGGHPGAGVARALGGPAA